jgi:uncharacterized protein (TIGR02172 family)
MDLGEPIAFGRTAEVYAWKEGQVLKLFYEWFSASAVEHEARVAHAVFAAGLPVPAPGELLQVEGRLGLVYERLEGPTMLRTLQKKPWRLAALARKLAELHVEMHQVVTREPPSQRERLQHKILNAGPLAEPLKQAALHALQSLPEGDRLCHGDFHPDNIIMTPRRPVIIDWIDVTSGHPLADFARTTILIRYGAPLPENALGRLLQAARGELYRVYQQRYFELTHANPADVQLWIPVVAAARLDENISEEESTLLSIVQGAFGGAGS